jgi:nucleoside-diphosphate-sugar epimerase
LIFRLSNVVGNGGNSKTVFNFLFHQINNGQQFELWSKSYRNIIDIDDAFLIIDKIIKSGTTNQIVNIASPFSKSISKIVESIEEFTGNKAIFQAVDKGTTYEIDTSAINQIIGELEIDFDKDYLQKILSKYYNDEL